MKTAKPDVRLSVRMPPNVAERISEAAALVGATPQQFVIEASLDKAHIVINRETEIGYSRADAALLLSLLDNPRPMNDALRKAFARMQ